MRSLFSEVKPASWRFIVAASLGVMAFVIGINLSYRVDKGFYDAVYRGTAHLVTPTLIGAGLLAVAVIAALVLGCRLSLRDFGWKWEYLVPGLAASAVLWVVMQVVEVIAQLASGGHFELSPSWGRLGAVTLIGVLLGQTFGTATAEETFFRGFLLPQIRLRLEKMSTALAIGLAIVISQAAFSLYHLPNLVLGNSGLGTGLPDIAAQLGLDLAIGVVFAALYVRTGNLFLVMGIHALQNAGTSIVTTPVDPAAVMLSLAILIVLATFAPAFLRRMRPGAPRIRTQRLLPS